MTRKKKAAPDHTNGDAPPRRDPGTFLDTEFANAERFLEQHSKLVRFRRDMGWFFYEEMAGLWRNSDTGVRALASATVRAIRTEAAEAEDSAVRDRLWRWAKRSQTAAQLANMLAIASSDPAVRVEPDELDASPVLFNCPDLMAKLDNGWRYKHNPRAMLTKMAGAPCGEKDEPYEHPLWTQFLETSLPDPEVRSFVQRAVGYSITGDTSMECLFFIHGPANAGKSTFISAIQSALGDYAATVPFDIFLRRRERPPEQEFAGLRGKRFVASLEVQKGKKFAEEVVKSVTGGDRIKGRFLYREPFEYRPTWKLWLVANDQPKADSDDDAFWRRIMVIPFVHPPEPSARVLGLKEEFATNIECRRAVLSWAMQGARAWYESGKKLASPRPIAEATAVYREEADDLAVFYDERLEFHPDHRDTDPAEVMRACKAWCDSHGFKTPSGRTIQDGLARRGAVLVRTGKGRRWYGVGVRI